MRSLNELLLGLSTTGGGPEDFGFGVGAGAAAGASRGAGLGGCAVFVAGAFGGAAAATGTGTGRDLGSGDFGTSTSGSGSGSGSSRGRAAGVDGEAAVTSTGSGFSGSGLGCCWGAGASSGFFVRVRIGRGGGVGSNFSTKLRGKMPSFLTPSSSTYSPPYHSSSSSSVTVMTWPRGKLRSSSWGEVYSKRALTRKGATMVNANGSQDTAACPPAAQQAIQLRCLLASPRGGCVGKRWGKAAYERAGGDQEDGTMSVYR